MANKAETTIVVFRAPGRPLVCLRASDLPSPLEMGQVFDFDSNLYQQTHKPIVCIARSEKGAVTDVNSLLKGLILRLYGEVEAKDVFARGCVNYSAVSCTNEQTARGGIRIGVMKMLKDGAGEDLVFVNCRIMSEQLLREAILGTAKGSLSGLILGLTASPVQPASALSSSDPDDGRKTKTRSSTRSKSRAKS